MLLSLQKSILLLLCSVVICCGIYPLALWMVGQTFFPFQANGSILLNVDGKPMGSLLIAQAFTKDEYFHPRPSAAGYDASASSSSSLAASNGELRRRVMNAIQPISKHSQPIPADMVTASGSGLDPHITLQNALYQLDRVSLAWAKKLKRDPATVKRDIQAILNEKATAPLGGLAGEKIVNVLEVNIMLRQYTGVA